MNFQRSPSRKRTRYKGYNYSDSGYYFVTICTQGMREWLGRVEGNRVVLNEKGTVVKNCLLNLPNHYERCEMDQYVIMPNHVHFIIIMHSPVGEGFKPSPTKYSLSEIVRGFKTFSSKKIHINGFYQFKWQRSYYDHVIRSEISLTKIRAYIYLNPYKWHTDEYFGREYLMA